MSEKFPDYLYMTPDKWGRQLILSKEELEHHVAELNRVLGWDCDPADADQLTHICNGRYRLHTGRKHYIYTVVPEDDHYEVINAETVYTLIQRV